MNKINYSLILLPLIILIPNIYAENILIMNSKSLDVELKIDQSIEVDKPTMLNVRFLEKGTNKTQIHVDYVVSIRDSNNVEIFRTPLTHTNEGIVQLRYVFPTSGDYTIAIDMEGILFIPIPKESVAFHINVIPEFPLIVLLILTIAFIPIIITKRSLRL